MVVVIVLWTLGTVVALIEMIRYWNLMKMYGFYRSAIWLILVIVTFPLLLISKFVHRRRM